MSEPLVIIVETGRCSHPTATPLIKMYYHCMGEESARKTERERQRERERAIERKREREKEREIEREREST